MIFVQHDEGQKMTELSEITINIVELLRKDKKKRKIRPREERARHATSILIEAKLPVSLDNIEIITRRLGSIEKRIILGFPFEIEILEGLENIEENT